MEICTEYNAKSKISTKEKHFLHLYTSLQRIAENKVPDLMFKNKGAGTKMYKCLVFCKIIFSS